MRVREHVPAAAAIAGAALALLFFLLPIWRHSFPSPPTRMTFQVTFPRGIPERGEPLVTTGVPGDADFLAVRYLDEENAVLVYDVWGVGGPTSKTFALRPGERRPLEIEMPTLAHVPSVRSHERRPLRVTLDGEVLFNEPVYFHRRAPADLFFATNPVGGTTAWAVFRGELALPDGRILAGGPENLFTSSERLAWMLRHRQLALLPSVVASAAIGLAFALLVSWCARLRMPPWQISARPPTPFPAHNQAPHRWFAAVAAVCMLAFTATITGGTFRLLFPETFGHFYDYQAASFLKGRFDLPPEAHTSESFVFQGRHYMYFGPTPALLRLPFVAVEVGIGRMSRCFMLAYYAGLLGAVYALLIHVSRCATRSASWPSPSSVVLLVGTVGLGSSIFFLGSRAYVYHEAILCGTMFALWSCYCSLRHLAEPLRAWWVGAVLLGIASVHARPPTGLFALSMVGCVAVAAWIRGLRESPPPAGALLHTLPRPFVIGISAVLGVLSFNALSYLKFQSFEGAPLRYHVEYHPGRLATIEGKNFHATNFPFNSATYFWRSGFELRPNFPFVFMHRPNPDNFPAAKIDLSEPTLSLPFAMPALFLLGIAGSVLAFARWPEARLAIAVLAATATPMTLALLTAVAVSHRYTADFCPPLIIGGAYGLIAAELLRPRVRSAVYLTLALLALASVAITVAITLRYQGEVVWGVSEDILARYRSLRATADAFFGVAPAPR
jgi:hypothetical protein